MRSKRKPKKKSNRSKLLAQSFTRDRSLDALADSVNEAKRRQTRQSEQADQYNQNRWFWQEEKKPRHFDGKPKKRKHNRNLP